MPEPTVIQRFSAEMARQQVAWVNIETNQVEDRPDYTQVDVMVAHVGDEGAEVTARYFDDEEFTPIVNASGFVLASCLSTVFVHDGQTASGVDTFLLSDGRRLHGESKAEEVVIYGTHRGHKVDGEGTVWFEDTSGANGVLPYVKHELAEIGLPDTAYPYVYIGLAHAMAHDDFAPTSRSNPSIAPVDRLLVDADMYDRTQAELQEAGVIAHSLASQIELDEAMKKNLTVFGSVTATEVPEAFTRSRRTIAKLERQVLESMRNMIMGSAAFIPIGEADGRARTWYYMNPAAESEHVAFGSELSALKGGNVAPAHFELGRELKELRSRVKYATSATHALSTLHIAEQRAIEAARA